MPTLLIVGSNRCGVDFKARVLRPLGWFGLLDVEAIPDEEMRFLKHHRYRKSSTFDAFLGFGVALEAREGAVQ